MTTIAAVTVRPARRVHGRVSLPGDKSISHRYAMLAALADGVSTLRGFAPGADCAATLSCLQSLGVQVVPQPARGASSSVIEICGRGLGGLSAPPVALDAHNSGTTMRLLTGVLAAHDFVTTIGGDASLSRRPMRRVIEPLTRMGARIDSHDGKPPLCVTGGSLHGIDFRPAVSSAQVKSAVLLAGLHAEGQTRVIETAPTRNHTELALAAFGADIDGEAGIPSISGGRRLRAGRFDVPGDLSSAAFWAAAGAAVPGSDIELIDVGLNPTRTAFLDLLRTIGARVDIEPDSIQAGEPRGRVRVRHESIGPVVVDADAVPALIDELPVLAAVATFGGALTVTGAGELRVKESDRISALVAGLRALGGDAEELPDGFVVTGTRRIAGGCADASGDHRLAMAFAIAALGASGPSLISGAESVAISYPEFFRVLESVCE